MRKYRNIVRYQFPITSDQTRDMSAEVINLLLARMQMPSDQCDGLGALKVSRICRVKASQKSVQSGACRTERTQARPATLQTGHQMQAQTC